MRDDDQHPDSRIQGQAQTELKFEMPVGIPGSHAQPGARHRKYAKIHTLLASLLKIWREGKYDTLVRNVEERGANCITTQHQEEDKQVALTSNAMVLTGKMCSAVRQANQRAR